MNLKEQNRYSLRLANDVTQQGVFNIFQSKKGCIYLMLGSSVTALTELQVKELGISCYELEDFNHDDFVNYYNIKQA